MGTRVSTPDRCDRAGNSTFPCMDDWVNSGAFMQRVQLNARFVMDSGDCLLERCDHLGAVRERE
jgi:hypothetical protein